MLRGATNIAHEAEVAASYSASGEKREGNMRTTIPTPSTVYVTPNIVNVNPDGDDSDPKQSDYILLTFNGYPSII
jgi:hypothetical protein